MNLSFKINEALGEMQELFMHSLEMLSHILSKKKSSIIYYSAQTFPRNNNEDNINNKNF